MDRKNVDVMAFQTDMQLDQELLKDLYLTFNEEILNSKAVINSCLTRAAFKDISETVHNVKGIAGNFRAWDVFENAKLLDAKLKANDMENIELYIARLEQTIDNVVHEINLYFEEEA